MLANYNTVRGFGFAEIDINKSRFLAYVNRAETDEAAQQFIDKIRKQHWDATHNCSAYVNGERDEHQKADDDGEPSGTAGRPILDVIKKSGLKDTVIVVTRYFGGIKLGASGLVRAYSKSASTGLQAAGIVQRQLQTCLLVTIDYPFLGIVENNLRHWHYQIMDKQFTDQVILSVLAPCNEEAILETRLADWTGGLATVERGGQQYCEIPIDPKEPS